MSSGNEFSSLPPLGKIKDSSAHERWSSPAIHAGENLRNGVFRHGETMESLFELKEDSDQEYRRVCEEIVSKEATPELWWRMLQLTQSKSYHLLRLHKRATNRNPITDQDHSLDLLNIWLSYARIVSNKMEILDYIHKFEWCRKCAAYYICRAELDVPNASQHLKLGISEKAEPREDLDRALLTLETGGGIESSLSAKATGQVTANASSFAREQPVSKRSRRPFQPIRSEGVGTKEYQDPGEVLSFGTRGVAGDIRAPFSHTDSEPEAAKGAGTESQPTRLSQNSLSKHRLLAKESNVESDASRAQAVLPGIPKKRAEKPPLSSTRRLKPLGQLGKAERIEHKARDLLCDEKDSKAAKEAPAAPKFTRKDISYMLKWDPKGRTSSSPNEDTNAKNSTCTTSSNEEEKHENNQNLSLSLTVENPSPAFAAFVSEDNIIKVNNKPYMRIKEIGKGGSSTVYRVMTKTGTILAIKKVTLEGKNFRQESLNGFMNEIALLKSLRGNPFIIHLRDSEIVQGKVVNMVMEVGEADLNSVLQRLKNDDVLDLNFIRLTWSQMLKAVHSIHEARIVHGDLKPANFLFVAGALKLIDFGIAKAIQTDDTTNIYRETQTGTVNYMSPESIKASGESVKYGRPSDIWSLGCILYQMLYGKTPFAGITNMFAKLNAIVDPGHAIQYPRGNPTAIEVVQMCLKRDPIRRAPICGTNGLLDHKFLNSS